MTKRQIRRQRDKARKRRTRMSYKNRVCYYCGCKFATKHDMTIDHRTPLSRGGKTVRKNIVTACLRCNHEKDNMTADEYSEYLSNKK